VPPQRRENDNRFAEETPDLLYKPMSDLKARHTVQHRKGKPALEPKKTVEKPPRGSPKNDLSLKFLRKKPGQRNSTGGETLWRAKRGGEKSFQSREKTKQ